MTNMKTLKEVYKDSFLMGNIYTPKILNNKALQEMLKEHFNVITAENIMKPALIQPQQNVFNFVVADEMMEYATKNDFKVVGHTLAWHQQTLSWIDEDTTSSEKALKLLRAHMTKIMTRYKGQIIAWDVLNEAIEDGVQADTKDWRKHLRDTPWLRMIGDDYIRHVFEIAHELDPNAVLYYNDYNLNYQQKREVTYYMVKELREAGVPIHGIGMQGHYHTNTPIETVDASLKLFSKLDGIEISVTELDVTVTGSEKSDVLSKEHEIQQAQYYAQLFQIYKSYDEIIERITFWGTDDATSWRGERFPTIFNKDYSPKASYYAIINPDEFLQEYPLVERDCTQTAIANHGTPEIGNESTWNKSQPLSVSRQLTAWEGATATAHVIWDTQNLYILTDVKVATTHQNDSIDIYLSPAHSKSSNYQDGDYQITITLENNVNFNGKSKIERFESFTTTTEHGYQLQVKIPFKQNLIANQVLGFDLQVNDSNSHGVRQSVATWNDFTGSLPHSTIGFGNLKLVK